MTADNRKIPDILLEQYILGELDPAKMAEIKTLSASDAELAARIAVLQASDEEILARYPARPMAAAIRQRAQMAKAEKRGFSFTAMAVPAAAVLVLVLTIAVWSSGVFNPPTEGTTANSVKTDGEIIYTKGLEAQLKVYRKNGGVSEKLAAGSAISAGDTLQVAYIAAQADFGMILSIDGRGAVTRHFPAGDNAPAIKLDHNGEQLLDYSYRLDDAPGFERFFFVTSAKPFEIATVMAAAQQLAASPQTARSAKLELPAGLEQRDLLLVK